MWWYTHLKRSAVFRTRQICGGIAIDTGHEESGSSKAHGHRPQPHAAGMYPYGVTVLAPAVHAHGQPLGMLCVV